MRDELASAHEAPSHDEASREVARAAGVALHRLLERWPGGALEWLEHHAAVTCHVVAAAAGLEPAQLEAEAVEILHAFLASPLAPRLAALDIVGREVPVLVRTAGRAFRGSVDLVAREHGELVVIDYKTDREADDAELAARYGPQLSVYADALARACSPAAARPRTELWLLRHGRTIAV